MIGGNRFFILQDWVILDGLNICIRDYVGVLRFEFQ